MVRGGIKRYFVKMTKVLIVTTNVGRYESQKLRTGLWLSELTHFYDRARLAGFEVVIASPMGRNTPIDPVSTRPGYLDKLTRSYWTNPTFMAELQYTKSINQVAAQDFDCIYLTGGHGTMYDFPENTALRYIIRELYENDRIVSAICHGVGGLLNVTLSNGEYLVKNKTLTGFSWMEEILARRTKEVPFNLQKELKNKKAAYTKALLPLTSKVCEDKNLITGQNPFSSKELADKVIKALRFRGLFH